MPKREIGPAEYADWLASARACRNLVFKGVDLREDDWRLARLPQADKPAEGCVYIGCKIGPQMLSLAGIHFGCVFPDITGRPYKVYRSRLYTPAELFQGFLPADPASYQRCPDWRIYQSYKQTSGADELIARRLHDHFVGEELRAYLAAQGGRVVAFMGGHDSPRRSPVYGTIAAMARSLARSGYLIATGGGPGLMEAANLGAFLAPHPDAALDAALATLAGPDADLYNQPRWLSAAWEVREQAGQQGGESLGVPTWFYGHEPPNVFAASIAKYFENSFREEGLLAIATHGIVFAEGNGGTVQEIFQDGCQNYYSTYGHKSPMILFDEAYWNPAPDADGRYPARTKPAWPLLRKLAEEKGFADLVAVTSDPAEVLRRITAFEPAG